MVALNDIHSKLRQYGNGKVDYSQFRAWIADVYMESAQSANNESPELQLCRAIEWECARYSDGLIDEPQLQQDLMKFCEHTVVVAEPVIVGDTYYTWKSGSSPSLRVGSAVMLPQMQVLRETEFA